MRQNKLWLLTPAEKAIFEAMQEVEKLPADVRLTEAITLLDKARSFVAHYINEQLGIQPGM